MDDRVLKKSMSSNFVMQHEPIIETRKGNLTTFIRSRIVSHLFGFGEWLIWLDFLRPVFGFRFQLSLHLSPNPGENQSELKSKYHQIYNTNLWRRSPVFARNFYFLLYLWTHSLLQSVSLQFGGKTKAKTTELSEEEEIEDEVPSCLSPRFCTPCLVPSLIGRIFHHGRGLFCETKAAPGSRRTSYSMANICC
jgi:hypothetical protein